jgi:hypothetical protein
VAGALVAAAVMALILLPFGTGPDVAVPIVFGIGAVASVVYFAVLVLSRQITRAELSALWRRLRALRGERSTPPG